MDKRPDYNEIARNLVAYVHRVGDERAIVAITAALAEADHAGFNEARRRLAATAAP